MGVVLSLEELLAIRRKQKEEGKTFVFTNGCFDILHVGHIRYLRQAKELGDVLAIGLNSDLSARNLKGKGRPLMPLRDRAEILAALTWVDYVVPFDDPTAERLVSVLQPDVYVKGGDYAPEGGKELPEARVVASYGGRTVILPLVEGYSTSETISRILERYGGGGQ